MGRSTRRTRTALITLVLSAMLAALGIAPTAQAADYPPAPPCVSSWLGLKMDCSARNAHSTVLGLTIPAFKKGATAQQKRDAMLQAYWAVVGPAVMKKAKGSGKNPTIFDAAITNHVEAGAKLVEYYAASNPKAIRRILLQFIVDNAKDTAFLNKVVPFAKLIISVSGKKLLTPKEVAKAITAAIDGINRVTKARALVTKLSAAPL